MNNVTYFWFKSGLAFSEEEFQADKTKYYKIFAKQKQTLNTPVYTRRKRDVDSVDDKAMNDLYKKSVLTVEHGIPEQKVDEALQVKEHGVFGYLFKIIDDFLYKHLGWWWYLLPSTGILLIIAGLIVCCCCCCKR